MRFLRAPSRASRIRNCRHRRWVRLWTISSVLHLVVSQRFGKTDVCWKSVQSVFHGKQAWSWRREYNLFHFRIIQARGSDLFDTSETGVCKSLHSSLPKWYGFDNVFQLVSSIFFGLTLALQFFLYYAPPNS